MATKQITAQNLTVGDVVQVNPGEAPLKVAAVTVIASCVLVTWQHATEGERLDRGKRVRLIRRNS